MGLLTLQINRLHILHIDPPTMYNFMRYIDPSIFSTLKDNSYLLEYGKQFITNNRHPGEPWYTSLENSPSWCILTVKTILMSPAFFLLHEPWNIRQILNFVLDDFTVLEEVSANIEPASLKERILRVLEGHKKTYWTPQSI